MRITVFGATGPTGLCLVEQASHQGHEVTAYVRRTGVISEGGNVTVVVGELDDKAKIGAAIAGADGVVNVLGPLKKDPGNPIIATATAAIDDAAIQAGVRRHVVVTAWGVGERRNETPWFFRKILLPLMMKKSFAIKTQQEELLAEPARRNALDITTACPGQLVKGDDPAYKAVTDPSDIKAKVTRPGLAAFLLHEVVTGEFSGKSVVVGT